MLRIALSRMSFVLSLTLPLLVVSCGGSGEAQDPEGSDPTLPDQPDPVGPEESPDDPSPDAGSGAETEAPPTVPVCPLPPELASFASRYAQAVCEGAAGCCKGDNLTFDVKKCVDEVTSSFGVAQCVTLDAQAGDRCIAAVEEMAGQCALPRNVVDLHRAACAGAVVGTVAAGGYCQTGLDCDSPSDGTAYCNLDEAKCVTLHFAKQEGASCDTLAEPEVWDCDPNEGLYCNPATARCEPVGLPSGACAETFSSTPSCVTGHECWLDVCEPLGQPGDACGWGKLPCEGWCDKTTNTCVALRASGESCDSGEECGRGATCSSGVCVPESYWLTALPAAQCRVTTQ